MTKEELKVFNELSRKLCNELKKNDKCLHCPFYQWDTYYSCFDYKDCEYPLTEEQYEQTKNND